MWLGHAGPGDIYEQAVVKPVLSLSKERSRESHTSLPAGRQVFGLTRFETAEDVVVSSLLGGRFILSCKVFCNRSFPANLTDSLRA